MERILSIYYSQRSTSNRYLKMLLKLNPKSYIVVNIRVVKENFPFLFYFVIRQKCKIYLENCSYELLLLYVPSFTGE